MRHLLTYFKEGKMDAGILCPMLESCRKCYLQRKRCCGDAIGEIAKCKFGNLYYRCFDELCFVGIHPLLAETAKEYIDFDLDVILTSYVLQALKEYSDQYDAELKKLKQLVARMPISTNSNRKEMIKLAGDKCIELKDYVANLNDITQEVSATISLLDDKKTLLPHGLKRDLSSMPIDLKLIAKVEQDGFFTLEQLKRLAENFKLESTGLVISGQTGVAIERLSEVLRIIADQFALFDDWIHDVNHYMSRIQMLFPSSDGLVKDIDINVDDVHSLDALVSALKTLKSEFEEEIGISKSSGEMSKRSSFEIYKLFHKYRYCFYRDNVYFVPSRNRFKRKVKPLPGIGTVALNIYHNAVKYLVGYPGQHDIETEFEEKSDGVSIIISSMGPVVNKEESAHLGEKGFRASAAKKSHRGNGKGLARVVKVCQNCGLSYQFISDRTAVDSLGFARFTVIITIPKALFVD